MAQVILHGSEGKGSLEIYEALDPETIQGIKEKTGDLFADSSYLPPFLPPLENYFTETFSMITGSTGTSFMYPVDAVFTLSILSTTSIPLITFPKTV